MGHLREPRRKNYRFFPQAVLCLLFAIPLFAQGPPLFQAGFGQGFATLDFTPAFYNAVPGGGSPNCVSSVANPYTNPKLLVLSTVPISNCTIGNSLSVTTPFQGQLVDSFLNGQGIKPSESGVNTSTITPGNIVATATVSSF